MILDLNINNTLFKYHSLTQQSNHAMYNVDKCTIMKCSISTQRKIYALAIIMTSILILREQATLLVTNDVRNARNEKLIDCFEARFEPNHYLTCKDDTEACYQVSLSISCFKN